MAYGKALYHTEARVIFEEVEIGTVSIGFQLGGVYRPANTHFICGKCGSVWGKILLAPEKKARHFPLITACREHGGGVFSSRYDVCGLDRFQLDFSCGVLSHDFVVMYDWYQGLVSPEELAVSASEEDWTIPLKAGDKMICQ